MKAEKAVRIMTDLILYGFIGLGIVAVIALIITKKYTPEIAGDGREYVMQTIAFQDHFSLGIKEDDALRAEAEFYDQASDIHEEYFVNEWNHLHDHNGKMYCNHFGFYSILAVPVKLITDALGIYPTWAYIILNLILYAASLLVIRYLLKADDIKKLLILALFIVNPAMFYFTWTHTEIYIFAFCVIGLTFYYNKQYPLAILFISIASMQNIGVLPLGMAIWAEALIRILRSKGEVKEKIKKTFVISIPFIPAAIPPFLTFIRFGTINLVSDEVRESRYVLHKAFDYLFDLNLGILPYEGIMLLLFMLMCVIMLWEKRADVLTTIAGLCGMLFIVAHQLQINSGMQKISRYNVWIIPAIVFFVIMRWDEAGKLSRLCFFSILQCVLTGILMIWVMVGSGKYTYYEFAPWTEYVMDNVPMLYNPTHGIFYSRAEGMEAYYNDSPVIYASEDGEVKKILLSKEAEEEFYSDGYMLYEADGSIADKSALSTVKVDEGEFTYINITKPMYLQRP